MGKHEAKQIINYLKSKIQPVDDPKIFGKQLNGNLSEYWRYRVGNYRIICQINNNELIILVVTTSHRKDSYN